MSLLVFLFIVVSFSWSLTLEEALTLSEKNNIQILISEYDLHKLEEEIRETKAGIYPSLSLSASYMKWDPDFISSFMPEEQKEYMLSLRQTLFDKVVFEAIKLAKKGVELQKAVIEDVKAEVRNQTKKMYYSLLYKKEIVKLKKETLDYWRERKSQLEEMYKNGIISEIDYLRVGSQEKLAEYEYLKAKQEYNNSLREFGLFIGYEGKFEVIGILETPQIENIEENDVLEQNTTLKVATKTLELYEGQERAYKSNYYPKLSAFFNYQGRNYKDFEQLALVEKFKSGYSYGVRFDWILFDGFNTKAKIAKSRLDTIKQREKIRDLKNQLRIKLRNLRDMLKIVQSEIKAWEAQLNVAERTLDIVSERYKSGIATYVDVLEARKTYDEIKVRYLGALLNFNLILSDINRLIGK